MYVLVMVPLQSCVNCDKDHMAHKAKDIYYLALYRENVLSPRLKSNYPGDEIQKEAHLTMVFWMCH